MGYIGSISHGTDTEKAAYARALGTVLTLGNLVRDVRPLNVSWQDRLLVWLGIA